MKFTTLYCLDLLTYVWAAPGNSMSMELAEGFDELFTELLQAHDQGISREALTHAREQAARSGGFQSNRTTEAIELHDGSFGVELPPTYVPNRSSINIPDPVSYFEERLLQLQYTESRDPEPVLEYFDAVYTVAAQFSESDLDRHMTEEDRENWAIALHDASEDMKNALKAYKKALKSSLSVYDSTVRNWNQL